MGSDSAPRGATTTPQPRAAPRCQPATRVVSAALLIAAVLAATVMVTARGSTGSAGTNTDTNQLRHTPQSAQESAQESAHTTPSPSIEWHSENHHDAVRRGLTRATEQVVRRPVASHAHTVLLQAATIDTLRHPEHDVDPAPDAVARRALAARSPATKFMYLVHADAGHRSASATREAVAAAVPGLRPSMHVPHNTFIYHATPAQAAAVRRVAGVAWVGAYLPAYASMEPQHLLDNLRLQHGKVAHEAGRRDVDAKASPHEAAGGTVEELMQRDRR